MPLQKIVQVTGHRGRRMTAGFDADGSHDLGEDPRRGGKAEGKRPEGIHLPVDRKSKILLLAELLP
jgi:hypothetical protein